MDGYPSSPNFNSPRRVFYVDNQEKDKKARNAY